MTAPDMRKTGLFAPVTAICAGCHGEKGRPSPWGTSPFYPRVPQLADVADGSRDLRRRQTRNPLFRHGRVEALMPEKDIWRVAAFLSRVAGLTPSVEARWNARP